MHEDAVNLLRRAFEAARRSGKPDWRRMTIAVLKNRLLTLSQGKFSESDFGARNITEFVLKAPDVVSLDRSQYPAIVEWIAESQDDQITTQGKGGYERVRPDLWQAVMDYSSGNKYVWDKAKAVARPQTTGDTDELLMPTISFADYSTWQEAFAKSIEGTIDEGAKRRLHTWIERKTSPRFLSPALLTSWNEYVKKQNMDLLTRWFAEHGIAGPEKITVVAAPRIARLARDDNVDELRRFVIECVRVMNEQELQELRLPPLAALRARK